MSSDWSDDIFMMQQHYGINYAVAGFDREKFIAYMQFRIKFLQEELDELETAKTPEDVVDALIDLCVVAIGTLDSAKVDVYRAWDEVLEANMKKTPGVKPERPNPLGLPDLIKPEGWVAPSHAGNVGLFAKLFERGPCDV